MKTLWRRWESYWFQPAPLFTLAVCRLLIVGLQLFKLLHHNWHAEFADHATLSDALFHPLPVLRLLTLPLGGAGPRSLVAGLWNYRPALATLDICYWGTVMAGLFAFIGVWTNRSLRLFALGNMLMVAYLYSFGDFHHPEAIMMIALTVLAFGPAGGALSVDDLRRRLSQVVRRHRFESRPVLEARSEFARWPLLVIQWVCALIYLSCAMSKLHHGGFAWMNGQTLQYYLMEDGLRWNKPLGIWLSHHHTLVAALSWVTVLFEGTFFLAVIFPWLAWLYVPAGLAFHYGIYVTMDAAFFQLMMIYCVFVPWATAACQAAARLQSWGWAKPVEIFYDGRCPLCMRSMAALETFDWFQRLTFSDLETQWPRLAAGHPEVSLEACRQDMHVLLSDGALQKGFFAYREILKVLPPLWPLLILFYAPLASTVGPRLYGWIAARRVKNEPCTLQVCATHHHDAQASAPSR